MRWRGYLRRIRGLSQPLGDAMTKSSANRLGALALVLTDRLTGAIERELGIGGMAPAALMTIKVEESITIEKLAKILRLGQSSMVRAVQALEARGLVKKLPGKDRRTLLLKLTPAGRKMVSTLLTRRAAIVERAFDAVPKKNRVAFAEGLDAMLEAMVEKADDKYPTCRLCDEDVCGDFEDCPVERSSLRISDSASSARARRERIA